MRSSCRIIRGCKPNGEDPVFLTLRYDFPLLPLHCDDPDGSNGNGKGHIKATALEEMDKARARGEEILAEAQREAGAILEKARQKATAITREAGEKAREEGYREGREDGYREGYRKALEEAAAEAAALREEARKVLLQAEEIHRATLEAMEGEMVALAREMAEKIVAAQLTVDPSVVLNIVKEALEVARAREQAVIYVNPGQKELLEERREELQRALPPGTIVQIIGDPAVQAGGCRVETADGKVDATLEARWQALREVLGESLGGAGGICHGSAAN